MFSWQLKGFQGNHWKHALKHPNWQSCNVIKHKIMTWSQSMYKTSYFYGWHPSTKSYELMPLFRKLWTRLDCVPANIRMNSRNPAPGAWTRARIFFTLNTAELDASGKQNKLLIGPVGRMTFYHFQNCFLPNWYILWYASPTNCDDVAYSDFYINFFLDISGR